MATGDDPLLDNEPELARTMAASVQQRIAFGERAGEKVHHIGSGAALDGVLGLISGQDDILGYLVDADRVVAAGSSFGGYTVLKLMEQDPRVLTGLPLVPATAIPPRPDPCRISKSMMFMSGGLDSMVSYVETENFYTRIPSTAADHWYILVHRAGHTFRNDCLPGFATLPCSEVLPQAKTNAIMAHWITAFFLRYVAGDQHYSEFLEPTSVTDTDYVVLKTITGTTPGPMPAAVP